MRMVFFIVFILFFFGGLQPSMAGLVIKNGMTVELDVMPGMRYEKSLSLLNSGSKPLHLALYQTDYHFTASGQNHYDSPATRPRSNAGWLTLNRKQVRLMPQSSVDLPYVIDVPQLKSSDKNTLPLAGSYWSMIMVELETPGTKPGEARQVIRYAIQVVTHMSQAGGEPDVQFLEQGVVDRRKPEDNTANWVYEIDLLNDGNRSIRPEYWLEIYNESGEPVQKIDGANRMIYPGTSVRFSAPLEGLTVGKYYSGVVMADGGGDNELFGVEVDFKIPK